MVIYMYIAPRPGTDGVNGVNFIFRIIKILSNCPFLLKLFPSNDILTIFHIQVSTALETYVDLALK